jgi:two-component system, response regulator / RNA-binding antiterminator
MSTLARDGAGAPRPDRVLARALQPRRDPSGALSLKVLLADADPARAHLLEAGLGAAGAGVIVRPRADESLQEAVARERPDVVIVDMARPDRDALDCIRHITRDDPRPVVMFVDGDDPAFMEAAIEAGVSSYNVVGAARPEVKPIVAAAVALFRRQRRIEEDLRRAEATLRERSVIERAKAALIRERRLSEPEAYRWLRRRAMDRGRRVAEIAAEVLGPGDRGGRDDAG